MPEISRFFGIIIRMYAEADAPHHRPHFHAYYQDYVAVPEPATMLFLGGGLLGMAGFLRKKFKKQLV